MTIDKSNVLSLFCRAPQKVTLSDGAEVFIRRISAMERVQWMESAAVKAEGSVDLSRAMKSRALLVVMCLSDPSGSRLLGDDQVDAVMADFVRLDELADNAMRVNGMGGKGEAELEKN